MEKIPFQRKLGMLVYYYTNIWQVPNWARHLPLILGVLLILLLFSTVWELKNILLRKLDGLSVQVSIQNPQIMPLTSAHNVSQEEVEVKTSNPAKQWGTKNEAAPVSSKYLGKESARYYIERYSKTAQVEMQKFGIPASISLAQGLIESRAGTSKLAKSNNNHFGIKCFSKRCRKGHCSNFTDDTHKDFFRVFKSPWESWREHSRMISTGRYTKLKEHGRDYRKWAYGLKKLGYATDRTYAEKLIGIIEEYELYKYDRVYFTLKP